jgi:hypothetical protein
MNLEQLEKLDKIPLSDAVFEHSIGVPASEIVMYKDLGKYSSIDELLPKDKSYKIIFLNYGVRVGHWVLIMKLNGKFEYFNSYGIKYDNDLNCLSRSIKMILGEDVRQITRLLGKNKCSHNQFRLQSKESDSCGRYVISRVQMMQMGFNNQEYKKYLDDIKDKYDISYDLVSCLLVPIPRQSESF